MYTGNPLVAVDAAARAATVSSGSGSAGRNGAKLVFGACSASRGAEVTEKLTCFHCKTATLQMSHQSFLAFLRTPPKLAKAWFQDVGKEHGSLGSPTSLSFFPSMVTGFPGLHSACFQWKRCKLLLLIKSYRISGIDYTVDATLTHRSLEDVLIALIGSLQQVAKTLPARRKQDEQSR